MAARGGGHHGGAAPRVPVRIGLVTVSDTRTPETDRNGRWLRDRVSDAGHSEVGYRLVRDEPPEIAAALDALIDAGAGVVLVNGGTGISQRDTTHDVIAGKLEKVLPGFGELFRMRSWDQVGSAAMLSRAIAGVYRGAAVFSVPGSPAAVELAWTELIEPELSHLVAELAR